MGALLVDTDGSPFTASCIQLSYPFLDVQYGRAALIADGRPWREAALRVRGRAVGANQPDRLTVDIGMKAMATDAGHPVLHGFLFISADARRPGLGATVELIPGHCDTTVSAARPKRASSRAVESPTRSRMPCPRKITAGAALSGSPARPPAAATRPAAKDRWTAFAALKTSAVP